MSEQTIREQAQYALSTLLSFRPDTGVTQLQGVLVRLDPNSPNAD
jgi:hypothetical protein